MVEYVIEKTTSIKNEKLNKTKATLKHLGRVGWLGASGIVSIAAWYILWDIVRKTTLDPNNSVVVYTNRYGEMWFEYYLVPTLMGIIGTGTAVSIGLEIFDHLKRKKLR